MLSALLLLLAGITPALAFNEAERLAAFYARVPIDTSAFDVEFVVGNNEGSAETALFHCFNQNGVHLGPVAGTSVPLAAHDAEVVTLEHLQITTDPNFTGVGWCFIRNSTPPGDLAVSIIAGFHGAGLPPDANRPPASRILGSNASLLVATDVGQGMFSSDDASLGSWTHQASWISFLLAINPRQLAGTLNLLVYDMAGGLQASFSGPSAFPLPARGMVLHAFPGGGSAATAGHADLDVDADARLLGYYFAANLSSAQAILGQITLDEDDTLKLDDITITPP